MIKLESQLPRLEYGSTIGLCTPSHCLLNEKALWIKNGISKLKETGFKVKESKHIWTSDIYGVSSGSIAQRVADIHDLISDPEVKLIWFSQGGDTSNELLPYLNFDLLKNNPKPIIGLSDVSVLLNAFVEKSGVVTFHGSDPKYPNEAWYLNSDYTINEFRRVFIDNHCGDVPIQSERSTIRAGLARGRLVGGNFQCFRKLFGTPYLPNLSGAILVLEGLSPGIEESITLLAHYKSAGVFDLVNGIVLGDFYVFDRESQSDLLGNRIHFEQLLLNYCGDREFPILKTSDFGHRLGNTFIPLGSEGYINTESLSWGW